MSSYSVSFPEGSVLATEPQDDVQVCLLNGGAWDTGAFKHLQELRGLVGGEVAEPSKIIAGGFLKAFIIGRKYNDISLSIVDKLTVDCSASHFPENQSQIQIYKGDFILHWARKLSLFEKLMRWISLSLMPYRDLEPVSGDALIAAATLRLTYPPESNASISGEMSGVMSTPILPGASPSITLTFSSQGPNQPGAQSYDFAVSGAVLRGEWTR